MSDAEPRVRVELGSDGPFEAPSRIDRSRAPRGPVVVMILVLIATVLGLSRLSGTDASDDEQPTSRVPDPALPDTDADISAGIGEDDATDGSLPALTSALADQIDAYDRIIYTSISPELRSIVRSDDEWVSIDDLGLIAHSPNLLSWVARRELRGQRALALTSTGEGVIALTTTGADVRVISVSDGAVEQLHPIGGVPLLGAIAPSGRWAVMAADVDGEELSLVTGTHDGSRHTIALGAVFPTSIAVTASHVILTVDDASGSTSLLYAPWSILTFKAPDDPEFLECGLGASAAVLVTTGDAAVHLLESTRAWVISDSGDRFDLAIDTALLPAPDGQTVRPIATGVGWSVANTEFSEDEPMVSITRDGETFEPQRVPTGRGRPGHVIWAYLGGSEGVGVRVSDIAAETGLLRIGDVRARHPRPQELSRNIRIERPDEQIDLTGPDCGVASVQSSETVN